MLYRLLELCFRLTTIIRRRRLDRDLHDEVAFHLAMRESHYVAEGYGSDGARLAAERRFGNRTRLKEEMRDMWTFPSLESVIQDVRYAARTLLKAPGFTIVAALTLALGIGGSVTIYSLGRAASIASVPYPEPERLVQLWGTVQRQQVERRGASYPDFVDWRERARAFDDMALFESASMTLTQSNAEQIQVEAVSPAYFSLLGVQPSIGRAFRGTEDAVGSGERVAILSDAAWHRLFAADPAVVGRTIALDTRPFTIVGIMPPKFQGLTDTAQLWIPFTQSQTPATLKARGTRAFVALARLKRGVSAAAAQAELDAISNALERAYPQTNEKRAVQVSPLEVELFGQLRPALRALTAAVALVLLIACANVANLLLARSDTRQREIAVRSAIGASRARMLRQLLTESCVLTGIGAVAGIAVAHGAIRALAATSPVQLPSFAQPAIDGGALLVTLALTFLCGIALGLAPAAHTRISRLADALKESVRGSGEGRRSARMRSALIVAEISLAMVLLVGAGLMIRTIRNLAAIDLGFDARSALTFRVSIPRPSPTATDERAAALASNRVLLERVRAIPGVRAASLASDVPLDDNSSAVLYAAEGQTDTAAQTRPRAYIHRVSPDFFQTMGIAIRAGRSFVDTEVRPDTAVVIVSERLARRFWPAGDAVGKRIKLGDRQSDGPWRVVIGIVSDVKYRGLPENPTSDPDMYFPLLEANRRIAVVVRTTLPPDAVTASVRAAIHAWNPAVPVYSVTPLQDLVDAQTAPSRFTTWLMGVFAALALLLASVGVYGVMSYLVTQRTREIGIRLALGATAREILGLILGNAVRVIGVGVAFGLGGSIALRQLMAAQLFQVGAIDSTVFIAVGVLIAVGLVACTLPAARAARLEAVTALRHH
jgi:predicted permease